jgi:hypothetical protein
MRYLFLLLFLASCGSIVLKKPSKSKIEHLERAETYKEKSLDKDFF